LRFHWVVVYSICPAAASDGACLAPCGASLEAEHGVLV
jgi:hypothetical protein